MTDVEIARKFFDMLKSKGVKVQETDDGGPGFKVIDSITNCETLEFCFYEDGKYWRIMGYNSEGFYSDEVHKDGWK